MTEKIALIFFVGVFWFIVVFKNVLFWLFLWQLKNYHLGRFFSHFRTHKGKKVLFHPLLAVKIVLIVLFFLSNIVFLFFPLILFVFYFSMTLLFLKSFVGRRIKKPVLTKKTTILLFANTLVVLVYPIVLFLLIENMFWVFLGLLIFDIFTPDIVSLIVLILQPLTIIFRKKEIKEATEKIKENRRLITVGITGSYGKSSTKEFLSAILSEKFNILKTRANENSELGISRCILKDLKKEHQVFVCEMGAYSKGGIKLLSDIVKPKIGILTGINEQHMGTFGSQKKIIKAKYELVESLPNNGLALFNGDSEYCLDLFKKTKKPPKLLYSKQKEVLGINSDIWAENVKVKKDSIFFTLKTKEESVDLEVDLVGKENIENILSSVLCARELGMEMESIKRGIRKIKKNRLKKGKGFDVLDSSYSSNPRGVISNLEHLRLWEGKKIVVMPCLIELGNSSKEIHREIGKKINEICDLAVITTKDRIKEIQKFANGKVLFINDSEKIANKIFEIAEKGDVILLEGRVPEKLSDYLI